MGVESDPTELSVPSPTVSAFIAHLEVRRIAPSAETSRAITRTEGAVNDLNRACAALVDASLVTRAQAERELGAFARSQDERIDELLELAVAEGLIAREDVENTRTGFESKRTMTSPDAWLVDSGSLTTYQVSRLVDVIDRCAVAERSNAPKVDTDPATPTDSSSTGSSMDSPVEPKSIDTPFATVQGVFQARLAAVALFVGALTVVQTGFAFAASGASPDAWEVPGLLDFLFFGLTAKLVLLVLPVVAAFSAVRRLEAHALGLLAAGVMLASGMPAVVAMDGNAGFGLIFLSTVSGLVLVRRAVTRRFDTVDVGVTLVVAIPWMLVREYALPRFAGEAFRALQPDGYMPEFAVVGGYAVSLTVAFTVGFAALLAIHVREAFLLVDESAWIRAWRASWWNLYPFAWGIGGTVSALGWAAYSGPERFPPPPIVSVSAALVTFGIGVLVIRRLRSLELVDPPTEIDPFDARDHLAKVKPALFVVMPFVFVGVVGAAVIAMTSDDDETTDDDQVESDELAHSGSPNEDDPQPTSPPSGVSSALPQPAPVALPPEPVPSAPDIAPPVDSTLAPGDPRLLRRYPVQLYRSGESPGRPFTWTNIEGDSIDVHVEEESPGNVVLVADGVPGLRYVCGDGACTVAANLREDGALLVRFKDDGGALVVLLGWHGELDRWTFAEAPPLGAMADAIIRVDDLPLATCEPPSDCLRRASALWRARNHRYAIAYALASGPSDAAYYTLASIYASVGDAEKAAEYLTLAPARDRGRVARDSDFDAVRSSPAVAAALETAGR